MKSHAALLAAVSVILAFAAVSRGEIKAVVGHPRNQDAGPDFKFTDVPVPSQSDAAGKAVFTIVDGQRDRNGGRDFFGNPVPQDKRPFVGIHQPPD